MPFALIVTARKGWVAPNTIPAPELRCDALNPFFFFSNFLEEAPGELAGREIKLHHMCQPNSCPYGFILLQAQGAVLNCVCTWTLP